MNENEKRKNRIAVVVTGYPIALLLGGIAVNLLLFGVRPIAVALPSPDAITALTISAALLLSNHTWLMTSTELTRLRFDMAATPEEWAAQDGERQDVSKLALDELERRHNAHRNATENVVYFALLALTLAFVSPAPFVLETWAVGFAIARLGYTYSYLSRRTGLRGFFMSVSLLVLYGMAGYLVLGLFA